MRRHYITVPHIVELKKRDSWVSTGEDTFFVYRNHWLVIESQVSTERAKTGDKIGLFGAPESVGRIWEGTSETEWEHCNGVDSISAFLVEQENSATISSEVFGELSPLAIAKAGAKLKSAVQEKVKQQINSSSRTYRSNTLRKTMNFSWKFPLPDSSNDRYCAASMYQRYRYDISLTWTDFLFVTYDRPGLFSFRKVRFKYPELVGNRPRNWIEMRQPGWTVYSWNLLPNATTIWREDNYRQELADPFDLQVEPMDKEPTRSDRPRETASLYEISNDVFPPKLGKWPKGQEPEGDRRLGAGAGKE